MPSCRDVVFLLDVDNTLLDNDRVEEDLSRRLTETLGADREARYWELFEQIRSDVGYADYLGALQRCRMEQPDDQRLLAVSLFFINYPFSDRLYPEALNVIRRIEDRGVPVILSDGDAVFQPHKIARSGLWDAVDGRVLIYVHKQHMLSIVTSRFAASHYVVVDDKPRLLAAVKQVWDTRVTTILPRQGHYANDASAVAAGPPPDITIAHIGDLLTWDLDRLVHPAHAAGAQ